MQNSSSGACYRISATIVADSFIHIGNGKRTGVIKHSFPFIPGSIIRGSLGNCLQRISDEKSSSDLVSLLFAEEFGKSSDVFFKHCYPLHLKCGSNGVFIPSPKTLFKCQNKQCGKLYETFEPPLQCENCGKSVKPFFGFRCINCGELSALPVSMCRISASAIDRTNYTAVSTAEDMLLTTRANQITTTAATATQLSSDTVTPNNTNDDNIRPSSLTRKLDKDDVEEEEEKRRHTLAITISVLEMDFTNFE